MSVCQSVLLGALLILTVDILLLTPPAAAQGPNVTVVVREGGDAVLPCSPVPQQDMESKVFDWKKGPLEVFFYDGGFVYPNSSIGPLFKGRVSHFPDQLKYSNASILIRNTTIADNGTYTCIFPHLPSGRQESYVQLLVRASPKPETKILSVAEDGVGLRCEVHGAFPQPEVVWKDSDGHVLPAGEPVVSKRGDRFSVSLDVNVTKTATNIFFCVAMQEDLHHELQAELFVPGKLFESCSGGAVDVMAVWFSGFGAGVLSVAAVLAVFVGAVLIKVRTDSNWQKFFEAVSGVWAISQNQRSPNPNKDEETSASSEDPENPPPYNGLTEESPLKDGSSGE